MKDFIVLSICFGLMILTGCSDELAPTSALNDAHTESIFVAKNAKMVPHKGLASLNPILVEPTDDPLVVHFFYEGEGEATHFGHYTERGDYFLHFDTEGTPLFVSDATVTLTVANGDQVYIANLTGVISLTGDPEHPMRLEGDYDYAGGTGRFAGVSGHVHWQALSRAGGGADSQFEGSISTVGSNR